MAGAIEVKDRNSNVRLTLNSQGAAFIDTITPISVSGYVTTTEVASPSVIGRYIYVTDVITGIVAATNHLSITNPVGSGRTVIVARSNVSPYTVNVVGSTVTPMVIYRASSVSAGVTQTAAKTISSYPAPVAVVRTGAITATLGTAVASFPPLITDKAGGESGTTDLVAAPAGGGNYLAEGESLVCATTVGDVDQRWILSFSWVEI